MQAHRFRWAKYRQRAWSLFRRLPWGKIALFVFSLFLFILAITLMKEGAGWLAPVVQNHFGVDHPANSLGFGWLFAYLIMSGSPVAAAALTFFDAGIIDRLGAFAMITGSRLGASFIVLFIGFIYILRGRARAAVLSMGLLSLLVTLTTYLASLPVGVGLLTAGLLDGARLNAGGAITSLTDGIINPFLAQANAWLPSWALFPLGLGVVILSFNLFDKCLPQMSIKESQVGRMSRLVYRPWIMFVLGATVTLISMSVSVSLGILVPLSQRGFVRRENVVPYIMGANITTFIDTLFASVLIGNPGGFTVILSGMLAITLVSLVVLLLFYRAYERAMLRAVAWVTASNRNLAVFMVAILVAPILLLIL